MDFGKKNPDGSESENVSVEFVFTILIVNLGVGPGCEVGHGQHASAKTKRCLSKDCRIHGCSADAPTIRYNFFHFHASFVKKVIS